MIRLTIESTDQLTVVDHEPVRVWHGRDEKTGAKCTLFIRLIAVDQDENAEAFEAALVELPRPDLVPLMAVHFA